MFKIIKHLPKNLQSYFDINLRYLASFKPQHILHETSDETGSLLTRFAKHIAIETQKLTPIIPTTIRYVDYFPIAEYSYFQNELKKTPAEQIPALIIFSSTYRPNADPAKYADILNDLDNAAMGKLPEMDADTVLRTLFALLFVVPNWINRFSFYHEAIKRLLQQDFARECDREKFVQLCFYLGLSKNQSNASLLMETFLDMYLEKHLGDLTLMDLALVSNAAYKTSTRVRSEQYEKLLISEVLKLPLENTEDALLITFIKAMRLQRVESMEVCEYLSKICKDEGLLQSLELRGVVHIFAYFSEARWDEESVMDSIVQHFLSNLNKSGRFLGKESDLIRAKDLTTFLWCCAQLNKQLNVKDLERIEHVLLDKVGSDEFKFYPDQFVDACTSLWSLGKRSHDLFEQAILLKNQERVKRKPQPKVDSRLTVLMNMAAIEEPNWVKRIKNSKESNEIVSLSASAPEYLTKQRADITTFAKQLSQEEDVSSAEIICPVNGVNIPSILVNLKDTKQLLIELLNEKQILRFSKTPVSIIRLKQRLLELLGHKVIVLHSSDLANNYTNLKDFVLPEIEDPTAPKQNEERSTQKN